MRHLLHNLRVGSDTKRLSTEMSLGIAVDEY
jgi:hypothetical protein